MLLLDEDPAALESARAGFGSEFEVEAFGSAEAALARVREADFQVLVAADALTGTRGALFFALARDLMPRAAAFLLLTTPTGPPPVDLGSSALLSSLEKPVEPQRLARMVEQLARLVEVRRAIAASARPTSRGARPISGGNPMARPPSAATPSLNGNQAARAPEDAPLPDPEKD